MYRFQCSELLGIEMTKPKGFKVIEGLIPFRVNEKMNIGIVYQVALVSKAGDCLFLYPWFSSHEHDSLMKNMAYGEIKAALNQNPDNKALELDTAKYISVIAREDMRDYFNADTVLEYKFRLPKPSKGIYDECIGLNVIKKGHPAAMIKILLTEEGKKKEEEYMKVLFKSMRYTDSMPGYSREKYLKVVKRIKLKSMFRKKKYIPF